MDGGVKYPFEIFDAFRNGEFKLLGLTGTEVKCNERAKERMTILLNDV